MSPFLDHCCLTLIDMLSFPMQPKANESPGRWCSRLFSSERLDNLFFPRRSCLGSLISSVTLGDTAGQGPSHRCTANKICEYVYTHLHMSVNTGAHTLCAKKFVCQYR